jgi:hypothetical protein
MHKHESCMSGERIIDNQKKKRAGELFIPWSNDGVYCITLLTPDYAYKRLLQGTSLQQLTLPCMVNTESTEYRVLHAMMIEIGPPELVPFR